MRHTAPVVPPKYLSRDLYEILRRLTQSADTASLGLSAIGRGETPDGSGTPVSTVIDLSNYFFLPGRSGFQKAFGATGPAGYLQLSSTFHATKGFIYLGSARTSGFDETNQRLGIATATPASRLHILADPATSTDYTVISNTSNNGWTPGNPTGQWALIAKTTNDDSTHITDAGSVGSILTLLMAAMPTPGAGATVTITCRVRRDNQTQHDATYPQIQIVFGGVSYPFVTVPDGANYTSLLRVMSAADIAAVPNWAAVTVQIRTQSLFSDGTDVSRLSVNISTPSSVDISRHDSSTGTRYVTVTNAGLLKVESSGSFMIVPGAGATKLLTGDATGLAAWGNPSLLSGYHGDTLAAAVTRGDLIVGNSTPQWSRFAIGALGTMLKSAGSDPAWSSETLPGVGGVVLTDQSVVSMDDETLFYEDSPVYYA